MFAESSRTSPKMCLDKAALSDPPRARPETRLGKTTVTFGPRGFALAGYYLGARGDDYACLNPIGITRLFGFSPRSS